MKSELKQWTYSPAGRCLAAIAMAVSFWINHFDYRVIERSYKVPCCFYSSAQEAVTIGHAPEHIAVTVRATRRALRSLDAAQLAIHLDSDRLKSGRQWLELTAEDLFLPPSIKLVHWTPSFLVVQR